MILRRRSCITGSLSLVLLAAQVAVTKEKAGPLASVRVSASRPVAIGTIAESVAIHPNRAYAFSDVPDSLKGLRFVSHQHKTPANLSCEVVSAGVVYLLVQEETPVAKLELGDGWKPAGRVDCVISGRQYPWRVLRAELPTGHRLSLKTHDRWGTVLAAKAIELATAKAVPQPSGKQAAGALAPEFDRLARQLAQRAAEGDKGKARRERRLEHL